MITKKNEVNPAVINPRETQERNIRAAYSVEPYETTRKWNNEGQGLNEDYYTGTVKARSFLVTAFTRNEIYHDVQSFERTLREAHELSNHNNYYNILNGIEMNFNGLFRVGEATNYRLGDTLKIVKFLNKIGRARDYTSRFINKPVFRSWFFVTEKSKVTGEVKNWTTPIYDLREKQETLPVESYNDKTGEYTYTYPHSDNFEHYLEAATARGRSIMNYYKRYNNETDIEKKNQIARDALATAIMQYQILICCRPFIHINNSLFMNLLNSQAKLFGYGGIPHENLDILAQRIDTETLVNIVLPKFVNNYAK